MNNKAGRGQVKEHGAQRVADLSMGVVLVTGEVPVHLLGTAYVPLSKVPNPQMLMTLCSIMHQLIYGILCVYFRPSVVHNQYQWEE